MVARKSDSLAAYNKKRDFAKTAEPKGTFDTLPWGGGFATTSGWRWRGR